MPFKEIFSFLTSKFKLLYFFYLFLSLVVVLLDVFSIALIPIIIASVLTEGKLNEVFNIDFINFDKFLDVINLNELLYIILIVFLIKNILFYLNTYLTNTYFRQLQIYFQTSIFDSYLKKKYSYFSTKTSDRLMRNVIESQRLSNILNSFMNLSKEILLFIFLLLLLFINKTQQTFVISFILLSILLISYYILKGKYYRLGKSSFESKSYFFQTLTETFNSIKLILINKNFKIFYKNFEKHLFRRVKADTDAKNLAALAKPTLEFLIVFILVFSIIYFTNQKISPEKLISLLSLYTIIILKMSQSINSMFILISSIRVDKALIDELKNDLKLTYNNKKEVGASSLANNIPDPLVSINLINISFYYNNVSKIFENFNLKISTNSIFGIIGKSGSGKSTLVDLISGLLEPANGKILIDNKKNINHNLYTWQEKIGYIPQDTFILNSTIKDNICFGLDYNEKKFQKIIKILELEKLLEREKSSSEVIIGDKGGSKISGGQKQKISLARALYKDAKILILDEPTNSLDPNVSEEFFKILNKLKENKTIIVITHDKSLIKYCDEVFDIEKE